MIVRHAILLFATVLALSAVVAPAEAEPSAGRDPAAADALFRAAIKALDNGDWGAACTKFNASMVLDPAVSTLINIAKCHDHEGKLATAWAELNRALVLNSETVGEKRKADLERYAKGLIAALVPRLPKLLIVVHDRPAGLKITRDGVEVPIAALGDALPVDPGPHEIEASAPGYRSETRTVSLSERKVATVELTLAATDLASQEAPEPSAHGRGAAWGAGVAVLSIGGASLLAGVVTGGMAIQQNAALSGKCPDGVCSPSTVTQSDIDNRRLVANLSTGTVIAGAALATLGVLLVVTSGREKPQVSAWVAPIAGGGVVGAGGRF